MSDTQVQCNKCFYLFKDEQELNDHECPAVVEVINGEEVITLPFTESDDPAAIGPMEGMFLNQFISDCFEAAQKGHMKTYKARVVHAPEGSDNTYALGIMVPSHPNAGEDDVSFKPLLLMWTDAFNGLVIPRDPDMKTTTETQEMDGSKQD